MKAEKFNSEGKPKLVDYCRDVFVSNKPLHDAQTYFLRDIGCLDLTFVFLTLLETLFWKNTQNSICDQTLIFIFLATQDIMSSDTSQTTMVSI